MSDTSVASPIYVFAGYYDAFGSWCTHRGIHFTDKQRAIFVGEGGVELRGLPPGHYELIEGHGSSEYSPKEIDEIRARVYMLNLLYRPPVPKFADTKAADQWLENCVG